MQKRSTTIAWIVFGAAIVFGGTSLPLFVVFLFRGPFDLVVLDVSTPVALGIDTILSLLFFVQHSVMIRRSFQAWLGRFVPAYLHRAIFTVASGTCLLALLVLWQPAEPVMASAAGLLRWLLRGIFVAAILGCVWGMKSLGSFDALGIQPIRAHLLGKELRETPLTIRGPYRWVRHPLYTFFLVMMWCCPDYTADRLLLNATWTVWMFIGAMLEERDLAAAFGEPYRDYRKKVPMLIPWRVSRNLEPG